MSRPARAAGDAKASRLLEGEAASRVLDMADRLLVWLKLLVMAMPPIAGLFAEACCDCAVVEEEAFAAVEGTLRGVWVWAGLLVVFELVSGVWACFGCELAFVVFGVVMALWFWLADGRCDCKGVRRP